MKTEIIISGFGGQGIMLAGTVLCNAGMKQGKFVTFFPSYGAEMRGGTANCQVIISDELIGNPIVYKPDILLAFNKPSFDKFLPYVKDSGCIFVNSSLYKPEKINNIEIIEVPANNIAEECGSALVLNMVMLGAMAGNKNILDINNILEVIPEVLTESKKKFWDLNKQAVELGFKTSNTFLAGT